VSHTYREDVIKCIEVRTAHGRCRCLVFDRTLGDTLAVLLGRTVLLIVAQWFVQVHKKVRERERGDFLQVRATLRGVIRYFLGWLCMCGVLQVASPKWREANEMKMMGFPWALYTRLWDTPYVHGDHILLAYLLANSELT
jgi:hypothetical protein